LLGPGFLPEKTQRGLGFTENNVTRRGTKKANGDLSPKTPSLGTSFASGGEIKEKSRSEDLKPREKESASN